MKPIITLILFTCVLSGLSAKPYRIYLKDKGPKSAGFDQKNELYLSTLDELSDRAKKRRAKTLGLDIVKLEDAPVYAPYRDVIATLSEAIYTEVRWFNYIVAEVSDENIELVLTYDFVLKYEPVSSHGVVAGIPLPPSAPAKQPPSIFAGPQGHTLSYGPSFNQVNVLGIPDLHDMGIAGENILIGFTDTGFLLEHESLIPVNVAAERDFIHRDDNTANENADPQNQHDHGTMVLAVAMGYQPDSLIGTAPRATAFLAKSEDMRGETHMEEDYYAAALEWLEARGADIINTSLGYRDMDAGEQNYTFEELDGRQPVSTRAANKAAEKGVLMIIAAGNAGPADSTIAAPADGDSVITVAGMVPDISDLWGGSSHGPVASKRLKPDVSAVGTGVFVPAISSSSEVISSSGTSFSAPVISGAAAALLSANPNLTQNELKEIIKNAGRNAQAPDTRQGYGVPDFGLALSGLDCFLAPVSSYREADIVRVVTYLKSVGVPELHVLPAGQQESVFYMHQGIREFQYYADVPLTLFGTGETQCFVIIPCENNYVRYPYEENDFHVLDQTEPDIAFGVDPETLPKGGSSVGDDGSAPNLIFSDGMIAIDTRNTAFRSVRIYDMIGNLLFANTDSGFSGRISMSGYPAGLYMAQVQTDSGIFSYKLMNGGR